MNRQTNVFTAYSQIGKTGRPEDTDRSIQREVETLEQLTDYVQAEGLANLGLCADLTLVRSRVANLRGAHFEGPLVGPVRVQGLEALVISVCENPHCQDV